MLELKAAIRKMKRKGAPGDDDIPPPFLKELGPKALKELLDICNASFLHADVPQTWRHAVIIPLLKNAKPASDVESYRPISLTSCVVKVLERMISNRLYTMGREEQLDLQPASRVSQGQVNRRSSHQTDPEDQRWLPTTPKAPQNCYGTPRLQQSIRQNLEGETA